MAIIRDITFKVGVQLGASAGQVLNSIGRSMDNTTRTLHDRYKELDRTFKKLSNDGARAEQRMYSEEKKRATLNSKLEQQQKIALEAAQQQVYHEEILNFQRGNYEKLLIRLNALAQNPPSPMATLEEKAAYTEELKAVTKAAETQRKVVENLGGTVNKYAKQAETATNKVNDLKDKVNTATEAMDKQRAAMEANKQAAEKIADTVTQANKAWYKANRYEIANDRAKDRFKTAWDSFNAGDKDKAKFYFRSAWRNFSVSMRSFMGNLSSLLPMVAVTAFFAAVTAGLIGLIKLSKQAVAYVRDLEQGWVKVKLAMDDATKSFQDYVAIQREAANIGVAPDLYQAVATKYTLLNTLLPQEEVNRRSIDIAQFARATSLNEKNADKLVLAIHELEDSMKDYTKENEQWIMNALAGVYAKGSMASSPQGWEKFLKEVPRIQGDLKRLGISPSETMATMTVMSRYYKEDPKLMTTALGGMAAAFDKGAEINNVVRAMSASDKDYNFKDGKDMLRQLGLLQTMVAISQYLDSIQGTELAAENPRWNNEAIFGYRTGKILSANIVSMAAEIKEVRKQLEENNGLFREKLMQEYKQTLDAKYVDLKAAWGGLLMDIGVPLMDMVKEIVPILTALVKFLGPILGTLFTVIRDTVVPILRAIRQVVEEFVDNWDRTAGRFLRWLNNFSQGVSDLRNGFDTIWNSAVRGVSGVRLGTAVIEASRGDFTNAAKTLNFDKIKGGVEQIGDTLKSGFWKWPADPTENPLMPTTNQQDPFQQFNTIPNLNPPAQQGGNSISLNPTYNITAPGADKQDIIAAIDESNRSLMDNLNQYSLRMGIGEYS